MKTVTEKQNNSQKTTSKSFDYIEAMSSDGTSIKVAKATIIELLKDEVDKRAMQDGVFIMCHRKSDNYPIMVRPNQWKGYQDKGEIAEGVVVVDGDKKYVVAPTEASQPLIWSTAAVNGGGFMSSDRMKALDDWASKGNTEAQYLHSECQPETTAVGFCSKYARVNANGKGLTAGRWNLPAAGVAVSMYANKQKINYALSQIDGAELLQEAWYWTSSEYSSTTAWSLFLSDGNFTSYYAKAAYKGRVRAVSAFYY